VIEPGPDALLAGVADSLEQTVLPDLTSGPLRRQVREAIRVVRRVALVLDGIAPALREDVADMEATLQAIVGPREHEPAWRTLRSRLDELAAPDEAEADSLRRHHAALQNLLIEVDAAIHALPDPAARAAALTRLRALYRRMLLRERSLTRPGSA
jgi:hypothetical protein